VPQTVGTKKTAFRVGMFNMLDREGLKSDLNSSSKSPNPLFDGLLGYMIDYDVNLPDTTETTIGVYRRNDLTTGRLLGAMNGFTKVGEGGTDYSFFPGQIYTGSMTLKNLLEGVEITGSISHFGKMLSQFNTIDRNLYIDNIGMLGFHVNSKVFGSSKEVNTPDNGIDFLDVKVEILPKL